MIVAVDGPAGAGKSTICKIVGEELNLEYIDTGAMYRALTFKIIENGINIEDIKKVKEVLKTSKIDFLDRKIYLDGKDVSNEIRDKGVNEKVSLVAKIPEVREKLVALQRDIAKEKDTIMDGRDIGSNVLKNADVKVFLTAKAIERAERRFKEFQEKGINCTLEEVLENIEERDKIDINREVSPLCRAEDAVLLDTTGKGIKEVVDEIITLIKRGR